MIFRVLIGVVIILGVCCCSVDRPEETQECPYMDSTSESHLREAYFNRMLSNPPYQKYFGVGMNQELMQVLGQSEALYTDISGNKYCFTTITTVITNDTTLPVQMKISFSNEYTYPVPYNAQKFKLFLFPIKESMHEQIDYDHRSEELKKVSTSMSTSITLSDGLLGTILEETKFFIENYIPYTLDQTIDPNEKYTIKIGILWDQRNDPPGQLALISKGHMFAFFSHYCEINQIVSVNKPSSLFLGIDFFSSYRTDDKCFAVIPCGEISFSNN